MKSNFFKLVDLPEGDWSVSWPGYEEHVVNTPEKLKNLLEMLFEQIKVDEVMLGIIYTKDKFETLHISSDIHYRNHSKETFEHLFKNVGNGRISGCRLPTLKQAEQLIDIFEKRLVWYRLSHGSESHS